MLLQLGDVPELALRSQAGVVWRHAASDVALGSTVEMVAHLGLHVVVEGAAEENGAGAEHGAAEGVCEIQLSPLDVLVKKEVSFAANIRQVRLP